jgi:hypothetical protein
MEPNWAHVNSVVSGTIIKDSSFQGGRGRGGAAAAAAECTFSSHTRGPQKYCLSSHFHFSIPEYCVPGKTQLFSWFCFSPVMKETMCPRRLTITTEDCMHCSGLATHYQGPKRCNTVSPPYTGDMHEITNTNYSFYSYEMMHPIT